MILSSYQKPSFGATLNRQHPFSNGLMSSLLFNEGSGNQVHDYAKQKSYPILGSGWSWTVDSHGSAIKGSPNIQIPIHEPLLNGLTNFTIAIRTILTPPFGNCALFGEVGGYDNTELVFYDNRLMFRVRSQDVRHTISYTIVSPGLYFIVCVYAQDHIVLYLNQTNVGSLPHSGTITSNPDAFGLLQYYADGFSYPGVVDYFSLYNRVFSPQEITYLCAFPCCMYQQGYEAWTSTILTIVHNLVVQGLTQAITAGALSLSQVHNLTVNGLNQLLLTGNITLSQLHNLLVDGVSQAQTIYDVLLTQSHILTIAGADQVIGITNVILTQLHNILVHNLSQHDQIGSLSLSQLHRILVNSLAQFPEIDNLSLTQKHTLIVEALWQTLQVDVVRFLSPENVATILRTIYVPSLARTLNVPSLARTLNVPSLARTIKT